MKQIEYSQIVRKKLQSLKAYLTDEFGTVVAQKSIRQITTSVRNLGKFPEKVLLCRLCMILSVITGTYMSVITIFFIELKRMQ